jgi:hypothetical protein
VCVGACNAALERNGEAIPSDLEESTRGVATWKGQEKTGAESDAYYAGQDARKANAHPSGKQQHKEDSEAAGEQGVGGRTKNKNENKKKEQEVHGRWTFGATSSGTPSSLWVSEIYPFDIPEGARIRIERKHSKSSGEGGQPAAAVEVVGTEWIYHASLEQEGVGRMQAVRKPSFMRCHFTLETESLPRQARDEHRESTQKRVVAFSYRWVWEGWMRGATG